MERTKEAVGAFLGLSPIETDIVINTIKQKVVPLLSLIARILFIVGFIYCLMVYTIVSIFLFVLGYYIIQLERKVEILEKRLKGDIYD